MKIVHETSDNLVQVVHLNIVQEDYAEKTKKKLSNYRRNAEIKGFRKGMAPMSLIEKMHGRQILLEVVNDLISEGLNNYIKDNNLNIIGEPLPNEELQKPIDWEKDTEFEFVFDLAMAPQVKFELSKEDSIPYYTVKVEKKELENYKSNLKRQYGQMETKDSVEDEDFIIADLKQEDKVLENSYISLKSIADNEIKNSFVGKVKGDTLTIDVNKAFENDHDRAALLKVKVEELGALNPEYTVEIKEIKRFKEAEITQEFFDRAFGPESVKSEEEFEKKVKELMKREYEQESDYKFSIDTREYLLNKTDIALPESFLKRWLYTVNEGKFSMDEIEKDFDHFLKDFRWQLIRQYLMTEHKLTVDRDLLLEQAKKLASYQFSMYGLQNVPAEHLEKYAESLLSNEKEGRRIHEKVEDDLVMSFVKENVTVESKSITIEKLHELTN